MSCPSCDDGTGGCAYPYYGVAPHTCFYKLGTAPGTSQELPESEWPDTFVLDPEEGPATGYPRCGTYLRCPECGDGADYERWDDSEGPNTETRLPLNRKQRRAAQREAAL